MKPFPHDDSIRPGQVWVEAGKPEYRPGETPRRQRLWLVLKAPFEARTNKLAMIPRAQVELMNLETANVRRVNLRVFQQPSKKRAWEMWLEAGTVPDLIEESEPSESDLV